MCLRYVANISMVQGLWFILGLSVLTVRGKIVMRGFDLVEEPGLPDEVARIRDIADEADKKFHSASQKILHQMERKFGDKRGASKPLFRPMDLDAEQFEQDN